MIAKAQVIIALTPWLGSGLVRAMDAAVTEVTHRLNAWSSRQSLAELAGTLDSLLFRAVHEATRGTLLIALEDGTWVRMRTEDVAAMADDTLFCLLDSLPVDAAHLLLLREFSMETPSLSALRALYTRFAPLETEEERSAIASVARKCYPPFRWQGWLSA